MKVRVVDDQPELRESADVLISALGHTVATARDVRSAIELAMEDPHDLALVDIQMLEINGYEAARILRADFWQGDMDLRTDRQAGAIPQSKVAGGSARDVQVKTRFPQSRS